MHEGVDVNNTHLSMINPDYNMMQPIYILIDQYSAYAGKLKLESKLITVGVAMWPSNLCHPWLRKCMRSFFLWKAESVNQTAPE